MVPCVSGQVFYHFREVAGDAPQVSNEDFNNRRPYP